MSANDFDEFFTLMETLWRYYRLNGAVSSTEVTDYFNHLKSFDLATVDEAIERAPVKHPTYFPKWGELYQVCESVLEEFRDSTRARDDEAKLVYQTMAACKHAVRDVQPEPPGGMITAYKVCRECGHAVPVLSRNQEYRRQVNYLSAAISPELTN